MLIMILLTNLTHKKMNYLMSKNNIKYYSACLLDY